MTQNRWELLTCWEFSGNITCTISTSAQIQWVEHTREVQTASRICDVTRTKKKVRGLRLQCKTTELPLISYFIRIFFKVVLRNSEGLAVLFFGYWVFFHSLSVQSCTWPFFLVFFGKNGGGPWSCHGLRLLGIMPWQFDSPYKITWKGPDWQQYDNDAKHCQWSKSIPRLKKTCIGKLLVMHWPPQSLDMNIIKAVCDHFEEFWEWNKSQKSPKKSFGCSSRCLKKYS